MNLADARMIAEDLRSKIVPGCEPGMTLVVGSVRRSRREVHDIEILAKPILKPPRPEFGQTILFPTLLDRLLYQLVKDGWLYASKVNGPKKKAFPINLAKYNLKSLNEFLLELYLVTPPACWGVLSVIRTGPAKQDDHFSKWCVTSESLGGALPDGYKIRHGAVWTLEQIDERGEPRQGECPYREFATEESFFHFLDLDYIEPQARHARWRQNGNGG